MGVRCGEMARGRLRAAVTRVKRLASLRFLGRFATALARLSKAQQSPETAQFQLAVFNLGRQEMKKIHLFSLLRDYYGTCFTYQSATVEACACCEPTNVVPSLPTDQGPLYISFTGTCGGEWCADSGLSGGTGPQSVYTELPECRPVGPTLAPSLGPAP